MSLKEQTQCWHRDFLSVVPIGGAIVHPRWWRLQPTKGNGCASPRRAPPTKKQPCLSHHGHRPRRTCLTRVDLHEVGDHLARTNSLVQLHNLDGGSQVTPNQSRRHHSAKGNRWCVDDELIALVLQMIVSQYSTLSLTQIWLWWKYDLSGKQLGEG